MRADRVLCVLTAAVLLAPPSAPAAPLLFELDPVLLVRDGAEAAGRPELRATHGRFEYLFASADTRAAFIAEPERWSVGFGGACARMGALSSPGRPEFHAVHEGRLYVFASEACRKTFLDAPERVLERADPPAVGPMPARTRGLALVERAVSALGGAERVDALRSFQRGVVSEAEHEGERVIVARVWTQLFPDGLRYRSQWGPWTSTWQDDGRSGAVETGDGRFALDGDQLAALRRRALLHPLPLLKRRGASDFRAVAIGHGRVAGLDVERVTVSTAGLTATLGLEPGSGRVLTLEHLGRNAQLKLEELVLVYDDFEHEAGLLLPRSVRVLRAADGVELRRVEWNAHVVDGWFPPESFELPAPG